MAETVIDLYSFPTPNGRKVHVLVGRVLGIARRDVKRGPMLPLTEAEILLTAGVTGDTRGRPGARQVTVLSATAWLEACAEAGTDLQWLARRANLLVDGVDLHASTGAVLRLGDAVELLVTGELDPCERMDAAAPGLRRALASEWRGGVTCRVQRGGVLQVGAPARLTRPG
ncbi:MAG: MOSC domain-containing protein [Gammaproteobacteria bacterium]